jgi:formate hydrogenlyase subunit 6/NADH:ubiquinone oxidoreductase subunit I
MFNFIRTRLKQGHRTLDYPKQAPLMPDRFRGRPLIEASLCKSDCQSCADACPTDAIISLDSSVPIIDLGRCLFCMDCVEACPVDAISHDLDFRLSASRREQLLVAAHDNMLPQVNALSA